MELLTQPEIDVVMTYPDEARHHAWVTLLAQGRMTVDMIREAEGLEVVDPRTVDPQIDLPVGEPVPYSVTDDFNSELSGGDYGSATLYARPEDYVNLDLTAGVELWAFRFGRAFFWVLIALGATTLIRLGGRVLGLSVTRRGD